MERRGRKLREICLVSILEIYPMMVKDGLVC